MPQPVEVDLAKVERGTVQVTVDEDGKTRIREKYVVSAPLNGRILRISMDPGDKVTAGKTLLTMIEPRDPELLDARSVAQAEARVKAAEAALRRSSRTWKRLARLSEAGGGGFDPGPSAPAATRSRRRSWITPNLSTARGARSCDRRRSLRRSRISNSSKPRLH